MNGAQAKCVKVCIKEYLYICTIIYIYMYVGQRERAIGSQTDVKVKENWERGEIPDTLRYSFCSFSYYFHLAQQPPSGPGPSSFTRFLERTQFRTTFDRTPLEEGSALRRDLYLTTHNTRIRHPCPRLDSNPQSQQASGCRLMP